MCCRPIVIRYRAEDGELVALDVAAENSRVRRALALLLLRCCASPRGAEERIADIRQGTNLSRRRSRRTARRSSSTCSGNCGRLPATGGGAVPLTPAGERGRNPRFSPDGERVVYQRRSDDQWDLWLLDVATGGAAAADELAIRRARARLHARTAARSCSQPNRTGHLLPLVDHARRRRRDPAHRRTRRRLVSAVSEHGLVAYVLARGGEWSVRVLGRDGAVSDRAHEHAAVYRRRRGVPAAACSSSASRTPRASSRLQMLLLGEPRVLKPLSGGEDLFASRAAWRVGRRVHLCRRRSALAARDRDADAPARSILFAAAAVEVATPPTDVAALRCARRARRASASTASPVRRTAGAPRSRRSATLARRARRATSA